MKIIREKELIVSTYYCREFTNPDGRGGFSFNCDVNSRLIDPCTPAILNYCRCMDKTGFAVDKGVQKYEHSYYTEKVGRCDCGVEINLDGFTNTCECGRDYNWVGQLLAPRSQWGLDTGEDLADILRIP